jgi:tetratricopeptide (TPR) repeat protein
MNPRHPAIRLLLLAALFISAQVSRCEELREESLFDEALAMSRYFDPETDVDACRKAFGEIVASVRRDLEAAGITDANRERRRDAVIATLNRHLLTDRQVGYISNEYWRDSLFTAALVRRKGNCLATSLLYYLVAQELKLPIGIQFLPDHALVCWEKAGAPVYIETTKNGTSLERSAIMENYGLQEKDLKPNGFMMPLTPRQIRSALRCTWARVLDLMGKYVEARQFLGKACADWPENVGLRLHEAFFLQRQGESAKAQERYEEMLKAENGPFLRNATARAWADYLTTRGKIDEALGVLEAHWKKASQFQKRVMVDQIGELYRHKRNWDKGIEYHRLLVELDPGDYSYSQLGSVLTEAHRDAEAIAAFEMSLQYNPESFFSRVSLAGLHERCGNREKGRAMFAAIQEPRGDKLTWYCALVWYYAVIKEEAKLLDNMKQALDQDGSGEVYQYFVREPDLDPYRQGPAFKALMDAHAPMDEAQRVQGKNVEPEPVGVEK